MNKFILRLLLFILIPLPLLYGLDYIITKGLQRSRSYFYSEWNDLFQSKINADVLICGSSRAWVHISPRIIDSMLHTNSYNIGMDGTHFSLQYDRFKIYLQHNKPPKYIIHGVDFSTFTESYELHAYEQFLPYLSDTAVRHLTASYKGHFGPAEYYFPLYRYNNQFPIIKEGIASYFHHGVSATKYKGYQGQEKPWDYTFERFVANHPKGQNMSVDTNSVKKMYEYAAYCHKNNIKLILVFTPVYHESIKYILNTEEIKNIYKTCAAQNDAIYLDYTEDELGKDKNNFYNSQHLNKKASEILTAKIANDLKNIIK